MLSYSISQIKDILIKEEVIGKEFWGKVVLVFENGKITYIKKEETIQITKKPKSGG